MQILDLSLIVDPTGVYHWLHMFPKSTPLFIKLLTFLRYNNTRIQQGPAPLVLGPPPPPCYLFALVKSIWKGGGREPRHIDLSQAYSSMEEGREGTENVIMEIWKIYLVSAMTPPPPMYFHAVVNSVPKH